MKLAPAISSVSPSSSMSPRSKPTALRRFRADPYLNPRTLGVRLGGGSSIQCGVFSQCRTSLAIKETSYSGEYVNFSPDGGLFERAPGGFRDRRVEAEEVAVSDE